MPSSFFAWQNKKGTHKQAAQSGVMQARLLHFINIISDPVSAPGKC